MTVSYAGNGLYVGLSTDTKPTVPNGYRFRELDIGDEFVSDGTYWWLAGVPSPFSTKKVGYLTWAGNISGGIGQLSLLTPQTGAGTQSQINNSSEGRYQQIATGNTTGTKGGYRYSNVTLFTREHNPRMRFRFRLDQTTNMRLYIGFEGTTIPELTGDTPLDNLHGFIFGIMPTTSATNWSICRNDGDATSDMTNTGVAFDTSIHTISLVADEANSRFSYKLDAGAYQHFTTEIPLTTTFLSHTFSMETTENASKFGRIYSGFMQQDR